MKQVVVPVGAGVGSAFGFLRAPIAYEVVRTRHHAARRCSTPRLLNELFADHARRGRGGRPARRARPRRWSRRARLHALSRPGPRDRRAAARPRRSTSTPRRLRAASRRPMRGVRPHHPQARGRGADLDPVAGHRTGRCPTPAAEPPPPRRPPATDGHRAGARSGDRPARRGRAVTNATPSRPACGSTGPALIVEDGTTTVVPHAASTRRASTRVGQIVLEDARMSRPRPKDRWHRHPPAGDVEPPALRRRGAGPRPGAHRLLDQRPRGRRHLGRRVRPRGPHAGPGRHRHAGPRELDGRAASSISSANSRSRR